MDMPPGLGSRERMIEAAIALMRQSGLSGAGINEVVRESGAPKGSVYHFFPDGKLQLATEALAVHAERVQAFMVQALTSRRRPADRVKALFDAFARRIEEAEFRRSCPVGAVCLDLDPGIEHLQPMLGAMFSAWIDLVARHVDLGDARRSKSFAGLVLTAIEGAYVRCRAERSSRAFKEAGGWLSELAAAAG
jgi:TetR/AcrR family transcriptional regulator, lmrAB and yxaGH operons repressor